MGLRASIGCLAVGLAAVTALAWQSRATGGASISAEPIVGRALLAERATPPARALEPGRKTPLPRAPESAPAPARASAPRHALVPPPLDTIEPWTGRDLAAEIAAVARPRLALDRVDPWNPSTVYPAHPAIERDLDGSDPWAAASGARRWIAKNAAPKPDSDDPWTTTTTAAAN